MIEHINNNDLVIAPLNIKNQILKEVSNKKLILNINFMTLEEFKDNYFGSYKPGAIYYLMKKYKFKYEIALTYLNNIFYNYDLLKPYYEELKEHNLIQKNELFKKSLDNIVVIGYEALDGYLRDTLAQYNVRYVLMPDGNYKPKVYGFDKQIDEIVYIASDIREKLKTVDINNIYLANVSDNYKDDIRRIFTLFNLPINLDTDFNIYGTENVQKFLAILKKEKNIENALEKLERNEIYNKIIEILNKYIFVSKVDDIFVEIITKELMKATVRKNAIKNAINIVPINSLEKDKYYYVLGFNQGEAPKIYHDDDFIKDEEREKLGLLTSLEKYQINKKVLIKLIHNNNLFISYKLKDSYQTYYSSPLIEEYGLEVVMNPMVDLVYSSFYNKQQLALLLDDFIKYNKVNDNLKLLFGTYPDIPYLTYDNSYNGVLLDDLFTFLNNKMRLSYSSMNNYFLCAFRFYIQNILKLDPFEENFAAFIGSLFHECLSKMYDADFDLKHIYKGYLESKNLSSKEMYFAEKLYSNLEFIVEIIRKKESCSKFNKVLTEQNITVDKSEKLEISFVGIVDKIKYLEEGDKVLMAIIDYKTGNILTTLDNINYGLNLQLPVYIYLTKNGMHKDVQIVGFYLQKILNSVDVDSDNVQSDLEKKLRLDGYTINNEDLIRKFDETYEKSEVIKSMSLTKNGFSSFSKLVDNDGIEKVTGLVDDKINEVIDAVTNGNFKINPKRINNKLLGCEYCKFKDICFRKEEDIVNLRNTKFSEIVGDDNA
ncbi:MAG: PD-(D/E)XK nuclease family protein [Bacilli bacterium]